MVSLVTGSALNANSSAARLAEENDAKLFASADSGARTCSASDEASADEFEPEESPPF